jgi:hypothetical protein
VSFHRLHQRAVYVKDNDHRVSDSASHGFATG